MKRLSFIHIFYLLFMTINLAFADGSDCNDSKKGPITLLSDHIMTISKVYAASENVSSPEEELIKIVVVKQLTPKSDINLKSLSQNDGFLKGALGKGVTYKRNGTSKLQVQKSIMGFTIKFEAELESINENEIKLTSHDYSHVFIKSETTLKKNPETKKIDIISTSYLKKSSFEKLNKLTFGNALGFIKRGINTQLKFIQTFLRQGN